MGNRVINDPPSQLNEKFQLTSFSFVTNFFTPIHPIIFVDQRILLKTFMEPEICLDVRITHTFHDQ